MQALQISRFPLGEGMRLIEASAGTGKTFTIANLYLRLLLEQGLGVEEILVVTFTEAATFELRERIRLRLQQAVIALENGPLPEDELLAELAERLGREQCIETLRDTLTQIDEAAIFTIHGFCTRVLSEHAFESGVPFELNFVGDEHEYLQQVVQDVWRRHSYTLQPPLLDAWLAWAKTPAVLQKTMQPLLADDLVLLPPAEDYASLLQDFIAQVQGFQAQLLQEGEALYEFLLHSPDLKRNVYQAATMAILVADLQAMAEADPGLSLPNNFFRLTHEALAKALKKGASLTELKLFALADELLALHDAVQAKLLIAWQHEVRDTVRKQLQQLKLQQGVLAFDDLLRYMDLALQGEHAAPLIEVLQGQYPCAMIDEFQDTDARQYRIFARIYGSGGRLFLIGDPKQAIYSFRNADVFTYMQAKQQVLEQPDSGFTLTTNWRSTTPMVAAINRLFAAVQQPFIYDAAIPFLPVEAAGRADEQPLRQSGQSLPALQWWSVEHDDAKPVPAAEYESRVMLACCDEAVRLLNAAQAGELMLGERPLAAHDLAFLVRENKQGFALQQLLAERGVGSVFVKRDSVYNSGEAAEWLIIMQAALYHLDEDGLRAALATPLLAHSASAIDNLLQDEAAWEAMLERFAQLHHLWQQHGFMRMFRQLLQDFAVVERLRALGDGERRLTNLLHLSELIAALESECHGMEALLRAYEDAIDNADSERESEQLRLENEANLATIITIHKSKGLQYPVVFLPFVARGRVAKGDAPFHHPQLGRVRDLGSAELDESQRLSRQEALAEDIRLLYVALTRAEQRCYLPLGPVKDYEHSALAYLLHGPLDGAVSAAAINDALQQRFAELDGVALSALPAAAEAYYTARVEARQAKSIRHFQRPLARNWWVTSYSYLTANRHGSGQDYDAELGSESGVEEEAPGHDIFAFPRGTQAGQCLHAIFEHISFNTRDDWPQVVEAELQHFGFGLEWREVVLQMLAEVLGCDLDGQGHTLGQLDNSQRLNEMGIYFPLGRVQAESLNRYLTDYSQVERVPLNFQDIEGMMKGFIDLVFEVDGRFYIVDYKSNHLGNVLTDYHADALQAAIIEHDYDLQYLIYSLALHRYLRLRIADYDYERHCGGVFYLFLRGMRQGEGGAYGVHASRPTLAQLEALEQVLCAGGGHG